MSLKFREEVPGGDDINLGVVSVEMVFKALRLCEVTTEWEMDGRERRSPVTVPAASKVRRDLHLSAWCWHLKGYKSGSGQWWGQRWDHICVSDQWLCRVGLQFIPSLLSVERI